MSAQKAGHFDAMGFPGWAAAVVMAREFYRMPELMTLAVGRMVMVPFRRTDTDRLAKDVQT